MRKEYLIYELQKEAGLGEGIEKFLKSLGKKGESFSRNRELEARIANKISGPIAESNTRANKAIRDYLDNIKIDLNKK